MFCADEHALPILLSLKEAHRTMRHIFISISYHPPSQVECFFKLKCFGWSLRHFSIQEKKRCAYHKHDSGPGTPESETQNGDVVTMAEKRRNIRKSYNYVYICTGKSQAAMHKHWEEVMQYVSNHPDEDPPERLHGGCR
eukprot:TRINITY_DN35653_c0_g1_i1.p1 TRINITY_DN35653_c0_g1~~TRINITY_DN35653_c0_g1_i1.p1  ORF type:complete len:148 (-),score=19.87 TRINITY_DN35653_c0_g1_i1:414-830(-)